MRNTFATASFGLLIVFLFQDLAIAQDKRPKLGKPSAYLKGFSTAVHSTVFTPDGKTFAVGGSGMIKVWDAKTLEEIITLKESYFGADVALSPNGRMLAATGFMGPTNLYQTATGKILHRVADQETSTRRVAFSPDGKTLAVAGFSNKITFWDPADGKHLDTIETDLDLISIVFSPDGKTLVAGGFGQCILWDWPSKKMRHQLEGLKKIVRNLAFSPDSQILVTVESTLEGAVVLWDPVTGKKRDAVDLTGAIKQPFFAAFSPDGKTLAVAGEPALLLWDVDSRRRITIMKEFSDRAPIAYFPDGKKIIFAGCQIWDLPQIKLPDLTIEKIFGQLGDRDPLIRADASLALVKMGKGALPDLIDLRSKSKNGTILIQADLVIVSLTGKGIEEVAKKLVAHAAPAGIDTFVEELIQNKGEGQDIAWEAAFQLARAAAEAARLRGGDQFPEIDFSKFPALVGKNIDEESIADKRVLADAVYFRTGAEKCFAVCRRSVVVNHELAKSIIFANGRVHIRGPVKQSMIICAGDVQIDGPIVQSIILARGNIDNLGKAIGRSVVERREPNPLRLFKFLDFEGLGIELVGGVAELKIKSVKPGSLFAQTGFQMGDRIMAVGKVKVESVEEYQAQIRRIAHQGQGVVSILRAGKAMELSLKFIR